MDVCFWNGSFGDLLIGGVMLIHSATDLIVYQKAYLQAMKLFDLSKTFPPEERYALTSQIRRSSRSVCMNLREAWAKRRYPAHFVSKLTDCDGENSETHTSIQFACDCHYLHEPLSTEIFNLNTEIGKMLGAMICNPDKFLIDP